MANAIRIKRRLAGEGAVGGAPSSLKNAELAFNEVNKVLYYGVGEDQSGNATSILAIGGEGWDSQPDLSGYALLSGATFTGGVNVGTSEDPENLVVHGNLTVNGTTVTISAETVEVEDKNIVLGKVANPTDTTADGGGITLKGATDKEFKWVDADDAWTSSEHVKLAAGKDLIMAGATSGSVTVVVPDAAGSNTVTLPAKTGTVALTNDKLSVFAATTSAELAGVLSDETGTGVVVYSNSPTLVTPILGAASATSINKVALTAPATGATLTIADGKTLTASNTLTFTGTDSSSVAFGAGGTVVYTSNKLSVFAATTSAELAGVISDETGSGALVFANTPTLVSPVLGTPTSGTLTNCTGLPISTGVSGLASGVATFLATPSSANLASAVTDETGSGSLVFATSPTLVTPTLGAASATSVNKVAITAPADAATLTIANNKTLTVSNTLTFTGTDSSSVAFGAGGTVVYESTVCTAISNCTLDGGSF